MECIVCGSPMTFYFEKEFKAYGLGVVDYWQCNDCSFVASKKHSELTTTQWEDLNYSYHTAYQGKDSYLEDPNWINRLHKQSAMLRDAVEIGLLARNGKWLDYACGDGKLSAILKREAGLDLLKYDRFMARREDFLDDNSLTPQAYDLVITTSVFEHLRKREEFDFIESLVSTRGVLGVHTLVSEKVPTDPSWFYLWPVHCSFHTNRSMSHLFQQWGFRFSVYNVESRLWLWFRNDEHAAATVDAANVRPGKPRYEYKEGFVDYWK